MYSKTKISQVHGGELFRLLANCFLFYSKVAVLILPTLLAKIQKTQLKVDTRSPSRG